MWIDSNNYFNIIQIVPLSIPHAIHSEKAFGLMLISTPLTQPSLMLQTVAMKHQPSFMINGILKLQMITILFLWS